MHLLIIQRNWQLGLVWWFGKNSNENTRERKENVLVVCYGP